MLYRQISIYSTRSTIVNYSIDKDVYDQDSEVTVIRPQSIRTDGSIHT